MTARLRGPALFTAVALLVLVVAPLALDPFRLGLLAKYLCFAIAALGIGIAWGQGGMLTLGQGVFFGLGGYSMAMYLKLHDAGPGNLPDFMVWSGVERLPALWKPFSSPVVAIAAAVLVPAAAATVLGLLVFRQRVRGAYFAILSQALAAAFVIWLVGQQGLTGGTNGLTHFYDVFGRDPEEDGSKRLFYFVVAVVLGALYLLARQLVKSRFGRLLVAVRDGEDRVRFLGYNPATVKTVAFAVSAAMAGIAGALYVPVVGIISPSLLGVVPSIELVVAVAIGGRFSLAGAVLGGVLLNWAHTTFSEQYPSGWVYLQGLMFILVIMLMPGGVAGGAQRAVQAVRRYRTRGGSARRPETATAGAAGAAPPASAAEQPEVAAP
ncbi:urea ABC transporter membrane protein [Actinomadura meyerae]|jgi:urea transport system permease protein|uniref:Urea ABC transporter membrane protein n=1 Tax=Actinomadura meyerae TaxID=240840 RepID=A0A239N955_9ACTN|nr:urea ABC transporter permease subunit UrtC [Actinomadura meyerae]SNT51013.1 urea ABC transporter membrane protein [Actinomadura meyerae]